MARKIKTSAAAVPVPQSRTEAEAFLAEIGMRQRSLVVIEAAMNAEMATIKERYERDGLPHQARIAALTQGLEVWAAANRSVLTQGDKVKTVQLATGEIKWRVTPPRAVIRGAEAVLDGLRRLGLTRFIRVKEEIDKEAILADPEAVSGVRGISIEQREEFIAEPFAAELEAAR